MNSFTRGLLAASALTAIAAFHVPAALADDTTAAPANAPAAGTSGDAATSMGVTAVDAGKLIGENVYDAKGDTVGEIDSVIVDTNGKVSSVVLDVGGWLSGDKRISVPWKDLKSTGDGKITTTLTKEAAQSASGYDYKDQSRRGKVLSQNGELYADNQQQAVSPAANATGDNNSTMSVGTPVRNADGTLNASEVIGLDVRNNNNDSIGEIRQLVVDKGGSVSGVVVDVGGFLGIGAHPVLLQWNQVRLVDRDGKTEAVVNIDKDTLKQMPAYKKS
jgi:sporulation protein YlmC with PRC-barrel domain